MQQEELEEHVRKKKTCEERRQKKLEGHITKKKKIVEKDDRRK